MTLLCGTYRQYEVCERRQLGGVLVYPALQLCDQGRGDGGARPPGVGLTSRRLRGGHQRADVLQHALHPLQLPDVPVAGVLGQRPRQPAAHTHTLMSVHVTHSSALRHIRGSNVVDNRAIPPKGQNSNILLFMNLGSFKK